LKGLKIERMVNCSSPRFGSLSDFWGMRRNGTENRVKQFVYSKSAELRKGHNSPLATTSGTENSKA
jgi:hypothetical protein